MGDEVVLSMKNVKNYCPHLLAKIKARWVGPITSHIKVLPVAYRVDLPPGGVSTCSWKNSRGRFNHLLPW